MIEISMLLFQKFTGQALIPQLNVVALDPPLSSTQIKLSTSHALGTWRPVLFDYVFWMSSVGR